MTKLYQHKNEENIIKLLNMLKGAFTACYQLMELQDIFKASIPTSHFAILIQTPNDCLFSKKS